MSGTYLCSPAETRGPQGWCVTYLTLNRFECRVCSNNLFVFFILEEDGDKQSLWPRLKARNEWMKPGLYSH